MTEEYNEMDMEKSQALNVEIKEDAKKMIQELKKNHIKQTIMLTGDKRNVGEKVAKELEIDKVYTELLPDGKVEKVEF